MNLQPGSRVILRPHAAGDVLMHAVDGRSAIVDAVEEDTEGRIQVAVVLEDDPARGIGKARRLAHRFFLAPDEVQSVADEGSLPLRILVAGIGNVFLGDDAFGVEVAKRLRARAFPSSVTVAEFGIRGMDLVYALGDGYDVAILIDAAPRGVAPGTLEVVDADDYVLDGAVIEGHAMHPSRAIALARQLGDVPARILVVACEPAAIPEEGEVVEGLSAAVADAVERAAALVVKLVADLLQPHRSMEVSTA